MDRASDSGSEGWGFESLPVYQNKKGGLRLPFYFARKGLERPLRKHASGMFLGRGRVPGCIDAPSMGVDMRSAARVQISTRNRRNIFFIAISQNKREA